MMLDMRSMVLTGSGATLHFVGNSWEAGPGAIANPFVHPDRDRSAVVRGRGGCVAAGVAEDDDRGACAGGGEGVDRTRAAVDHQHGVCVSAARTLDQPGTG